MPKFSVGSSTRACKLEPVPFAIMETLTIVLNARNPWSQISRPGALMAPRQRMMELCDGRRWRFRRILWMLIMPILGGVLIMFISLGKLTMKSSARGSSSSTSVDGRGCSGHKSVPRLAPSLALVVPTHDGDVDRALVAMKRWPSTCYETTLHHVDLILYHATDLDKAGLLARVPREGFACFRTTKVLTSNLTKEVRYSTFNRIFSLGGENPNICPIFFMFEMHLCTP